MNARSYGLLSLALLLLLAPTQWPKAGAQGFADLGTSADGFAVPKRGVPLMFPRDHGAHADYRIEWWYLTANLQAEDGTEYGVQWTLFRSALTPAKASGWSSPAIWMGHAAITTRDRQFVAERLSRDGIDQAGVTASPFAAWIDSWRMQVRPLPGLGDADNNAGLAAMSLHAAGKDFAYDLTLDASGPIVAQGQNGYSVKSPSGQASYYYSQPFYAAKGTLSLPGRNIRVTGKAWLDREWSSQPLAANQTGWDWFSLHFASGDKLMGFRLRDGGDGFTSATWISAAGVATPLSPGDLKVTPLATTSVEGRTVPIEWRLDIAKRGLSVTTEALNSQAWMKTRFPYWEGPIRFSGTHDGVGYLEMTGY